MGKQFLDDLAEQESGIIVEDGRYKLETEEISEDVSPPRIEPSLWTMRHLKEKGLNKRVKLKAPITGPFTLASYVETGKGVFPFNTAVSNFELVENLARVLAKSCEKVSKEASMVSIDEPILGVIVGTRTAFGITEKNIIDVYNSLSESCGDAVVGTHVCGRISPKLADILLRTELEFLSHEFYDTPANIKVYSPEKLKGSGKILSVGCLSTKNPRIETPAEILGVMKKFREYGDNIIFTPDCGFRKLAANRLKLEEAYSISISKLRNMVEAAGRFKNEN